MNKLIKTSLMLILLISSLTNCGGGDSDTTLRSYNGNVTGQRCAIDKELTQFLSLVLVIDSFEPGAHVFVQDASGAEWDGVMTTSSSFIAEALTDPKEKISGLNMSPGSMIATLDTCIIGECCVTLTGRLAN